MSIEKYKGEGDNGEEDLLKRILGRHYKRFVEEGITSVRLLAAYTPARLISLKLIDDYDEAAAIIRKARRQLGYTRVLGRDERRKIASMQRLSTGVKSIDELLGGGLEVGKIYGVVSEFGGGKSRFCHQLCVMMQKQGLGKSIYMDAENVFSEDLIRKISERFEVDPEQVLDSIEVVDSSDYYELEEFLRKDWPYYIDKGYKLLIIDTLVGPYRQEFVGRGQLAERQQRINALLGWILEYVRRDMLYCIVTDQVQAVPDSSGGTRPIGGHVVAHGVTLWYWIRHAGGDTRRFMAYDVINQRTGLAVDFKMTDYGLEDI